MFCICQFFLMILIFVINAMMSKTVFELFAFLSGYMSVFSIPQRQKWIKAKKIKQV